MWYSQFIIPIIYILPTIVLGQIPSLNLPREFICSPIIANNVPDSGFTLMSYALPNNPRSELIYGNHLYLGCGPFLKIYELDENGQPTFTGQVQTHDVIWDMAHDGEYLYVSNGTRGLTIYEGNDFVSPDELSNIRAEYCFWKICLYGDSLLFIADEHYLGILNISNPSQPYIERIIDDDSIVIPASDYRDIFVYEHYLIADIVIRFTYPQKYLAVYDLNLDTLPVVVDTVYYPSWYYPDEMKMYGNRVYQKTASSLDIYGFNDGDLELQSNIDIDTGRYESYIPSLTESQINGNRILFLGLRDYYPNRDSLYGIILAYNIDELQAPVLVDSTLRIKNLSYWDLTSKDNYTFGLGNHGQYSGWQPGLFIFEWDNNYHGELIGHQTEYSYCNGVVTNGEIAYATTQDDRVFLLDVSDKSHPNVLDEITTLPLRSAQMEMYGDTLYVLTGLTFRVLDISEPSTPEQVGMLYLPSGCVGVNFQLCQNYALICYYGGLPNGDGGFLSVDISDHEHPELVYDYSNITSGPKPIKLNYPLLFTPSAGSGEWLVGIYNVADPSQPYRVTEIDDITYNPMSVSTRQNYLYVFGAFEQIYDVSNAHFPQLISSVPNQFGYDSYVFGDKLYLGYWGTGIQVWDLGRSPLEREIIAYFNCIVWGDLAYDGQYIYMPARENGLAILRLDAPSDIDDNELELPINDKILSAYPNPFNSTIKFNIQYVSSLASVLNIYDVAGRLVKQLDVPPSANSSFVQWDGKNGNNENVSSGVYFARFNSGPRSETIKVVVLR